MSQLSATGVSMSFTFVTTITSIALIMIGLGWLFAGKILFKRWSIDAHQDGLLVGRRLGAVYLGTAIILFLGRSSPASDLRTALCIGMLLVMSVLAILGVIEFMARRASAVILVSSAIEVFPESGP
jgi:hypothetical protein